jgi:hypothetical protein
MGSFDIILINSERSEVHTANKLNGSCNLEPSGASFIVDRCKDKAELGRKLKKYTARKTRNGEKRNLCEHCFSKKSKTEKLREVLLQEYL